VRWAAAIIALCLIAGCEYAAVHSAPEKTAKASETELARQATQVFWDRFHAGRYEQLPEVLTLLTAAYLENPRDPRISLLLAHAHLWQISERSRLADIPPTITDEAILAERYFAEAQRLNPGDDRIPGWLGGVRLALGQIHQDERGTREGYFLLQHAITRFPEFNYFSAGYVMSSRPAADPIFREGVEGMWKNLDLCAGEALDRTNPDYAKYMTQETTTGPKRVCWNSPIAPHNFEGFFLNMGDMLVKHGRPETATRIYAIAKLSKDYDTWAHKPVLEERIAKAGDRARQFQAPDPKQHPEIMFNSKFACMACHQS
jgi:hypothetical protein